VPKSKGSTDNSQITKPEREGKPIKFEQSLKDKKYQQNLADDAINEKSGCI